jgi:hypothetical protein
VKDEEVLDLEKRLVRELLNAEGAVEPGTKDRGGWMSTQLGAIRARR